MLSKKIILVLLFFCSFKILHAQTFTIYGDRTFGGDNIDFWPMIADIGNHQMILAGGSSTTVNGDKTDSLCDPPGITIPDIWILKIDTAFNIFWNKSLGGDDADHLPYLKIDNDKIIFSCTSNSDSLCEKSENGIGGGDYWIAMIDTSGDMIWDKTFGASSNEYTPQAIKLASGDYIFCGVSTSGISGDKTVPNYNGSPDYWLVKTDSLRNKLWDKVYGGNLTEYQGEFGGIRYLFQLLNEQGTDFMLAGTTSSPLSGTISDTSRGSNDIWIVKLDSSGTAIWDKRYGGSDKDLLGHIIHTDDGGYIIAGSTRSPQGLDVSDTSRGDYDMWVLKLDSFGNKQWDKRYGGNNIDYGNWIEKAPGGGYWLSGYTLSDSSSEVSESSYGLEDYWILKIDSAGNKLWDKRFGGWGADKSTSFIILPDSSIFLCGEAEEGISAVKTDYGKGMRDYWLVHFKYTDNTTFLNEITNETVSVSLYPNPATETLYIKSSANFKPSEINLYDATGRKVLNKKLNSTASFSVKELNAGIYFYEIRDTKGKEARGKVVKE